MKSVFRIVSCLLFAAGIALAADPLTTPNERKDAPQGWRPYRTVVNGESGTLEWRDGALVLTDPGAGEIGFTRTFAVKPGEYVRISVEAAAVDGKPTSLFLLQIRFPRVKNAIRWQHLSRLSDNFMTFAVTMQVPEGATAANVHIYSSKPGVGAVRVKNFSFETSDKPFPEPLKAAAKAAPKAAKDLVSGAVDPLTTPNAAKTAPQGWLPYRTIVNGQSGTIEWADGAVTLTDPGAGEIGFMRIQKVTPGHYVRLSLDAAAVNGQARSPFLLQLSVSKPKRAVFNFSLNGLAETFRTVEVDARIPEGATVAAIHVFSSKPGVGAVRVRNFKFEESSLPFPERPAVIDRVVRIRAEKMTLDPATAGLVKTHAGMAAALKPGVRSKVGTPDLAPDLTFKVTLPRAGQYLFTTMSSADAEGARELAGATSIFAGFYASYRINDMLPVTRMLTAPWRDYRNNRLYCGRFELSAGPCEIAIRLPEHARLHYVEIRPFVPPAVPKVVQDYRPAVTPPKGHPRVWVTPRDLGKVRADLTHPENLAAWEYVQKIARKPLPPAAAPDAEVPYVRQTGELMACKAFCCLMTGEKKFGEEAVQLAMDYFLRVEFGNKLDVFREIGELLLQSSYVYDWCFDLLTPEQRGLMRKKMIFLSGGMECGWPPFAQDIVNGHGNETQVSRDLLAMAIAIYDEDPVPYRYCAWKILEQLVPMRRFEYASPRHNQGTSYGIFRHHCDMLAANQFRRMTGHKIFEDTLDNVFSFWLRMRRPDGGLLTDGDGNMTVGRVWNGHALSALLSAVHAQDPRYKGEFVRMGGAAAITDKILYLLLNDPALAADERLADLPLVHDTGDVYGSMIMRTGWNIHPLSDDVVAETRGGGWHFGNHRHADAGSFQIFYRTVLVGPIGHYGFYGKPYDMNFNKRSVSRSMLLCIDPQEKFLSAEANDGGSRFIQRHPVSPQETQTDPEYYYGKKLSGSFGPSRTRPVFSYFAAQHAGAYSQKVTSFVRRFVFLNLEDGRTPAAFIVSDSMTSRNPSFRKVWQLTSFADTETDGAKRILIRDRDAAGRSAELVCDMVLPRGAKIAVTSGKETNNVFGRQYVNPPRRTKIGHRAMVTPPRAQTTDRFLAVMRLGDGQAKLPEMTSDVAEGVIRVRIGDRLVLLPEGDGMAETPFTVAPAGDAAEFLVMAAGLRSGAWTVETDGKKYAATVAEGKNTLFLTARKGAKIRFTPGANGGEPLPDLSGREAKASVEFAGNAVYFGTRQLAGRPERERGVLYVPAEGLLKALGAEIAATPEKMTVRFNGAEYVFTPDIYSFTMNGQPLRLPAPARVRGGVWRLPADALGGYFGCRLLEDCRAQPTVCYLPAGKDRPPVAWITSRSNPDPRKLRFLLAAKPEQLEYWDAFGKGQEFTMALDRPAVVTGFRIAIHNGDTRIAKFAVETSPDGKTWKRVFDGETTKKDGIETFSVEPVPAALIRFIGNGNSENMWNSIRHFSPVIEAR